MGKLAASSFHFSLLFLTCIFALTVNAADTTGYAGSAMCGACHSAYYNDYAGSVHGKKYVPGSPAAMHACESCHGPGKRHVDNGGGRGTMFVFPRNPDVKRKSAVCLSCHGDAKIAAMWDIGFHKSGGLSCDSCHAVHKGARPLSASAGYKRLAVQDKLLKKPVPDLCFDCHKDVRSQTLRRSHHPIREGQVLCFDCHLPHGGFGPKMVKADSANDLCFRCHAEKRGPFVTDHPPVAENCLNCHVPHGSNHYALLVRKTPQLCQSCHDVARHPGQPYTRFETFGGAAPSNRMVSRNCVMCHSNVHGSVSPASRGQRFLR